MTPSPEEQQQITALVARFEADTGIQAVAAVTDRADAYPDIPWKAFAMGSALGAVAAIFDPFPVTGWSHASVIALDSMLMLACGVVLTLLTMFVPPIGRLFLDRVRAQGEALQYAQGLFLERQLFRTANRRALLVVLCRFERIAVIVVDTGLMQYAAAAALAEIGTTSGRLLKNAGVVSAFEAAFQRVRELLARNGFTAIAGAENEIADELIVDQRA